MKAKIIIPVLFLLSSQAVSANAVDNMFSEYKQSGVTNISEIKGKELWEKKFKNTKTGKLRSCTTCHADSLRKTGKHIKTGKLIEPMALSINKKRYTKVKKIKKWFKRNCKWTIGRECSAQEQADILAYLIKQ